MNRFAVNDVIQDKFKVTRTLGDGGMAYVLEAYQKDLDRKVALKFLHPKLLEKPAIVERFSREAITASKIRNDHVVAIYDVGKVDGIPFMVMEYLEGSDLAAFLAKSGNLSIPAMVDLILQAAEGLNAAHALGVVHRDLKPENLLVIKTPDGPFVKVLDFGISKSTFHPGAVLTATSDVMGTPAYMSPEQLQASRGVDERSDIWALTVILYEALAGVLPFGGASFVDVYKSITNAIHAPVSDHRPIDPKLDEIFDETFTLDPSDRIPSIEQLAARLVPFGTEAGAASYERIQKVAATRTTPARDERRDVTPSGTQVDKQRNATTEAAKTKIDPPRPRRRTPVVALGALAAVGAVIGLVRATHTSAAPTPNAVALAPPAGSVTDPIPTAIPAASASAIAPEPVEEPSAPALPVAHPVAAPLVAKTSAPCTQGATAACEDACTAHSAGSCFELGKALEKIGKPQDFARAATLYKQECDRAMFPACGRLGWLLATGKGVPKDREKAATMYDLACSGGDATSCVKVGEMYYGGFGIRQDEELGVRYFRSACTKGDLMGCSNMSTAFANGRGAPKDPSQAVYFGQRACTLGATVGCIRVADAKLTGEGTTKDVAAGLSELDALCTKEKGAACRELASVYGRGLGADLAPNPEKARLYAAKASK